MIFADTSYWVALSIKSYALHPRAAAWSRWVRGGCVTTDYVLVENVNHLSEPALRGRAHQLLKRIADHELIQVVRSGETLLRNGLQLHAQRSDKAWSLTDCISFVVMRDAGITDALTYDLHFEQAGFRALLRSDAPPV